MREEDLRLAESFQFGEPAAHAAVDEWARRVVRHRAWRLEADADDLVQDVKLRLLSHLDSKTFRGESSLKTFVQSVAKHACLDALRRARVRTAVEFSEEQSPSWDDNPGVTLDRKESLRLCCAVLAGLPETCRGIFRRLLVEELGYEEIAREMGVSVGTVKSRLARCRDRAVALRRTLTGRGGTTAGPRGGAR